MNPCRPRRLRALLALVLLAGAGRTLPARAQPAPRLDAHASAVLSTSNAQDAAYQRWRQQLIARLAHRPDDADAQLLLGMLTVARGPRHAAFARALQLAPQSPALAWMYALTCDFMHDHCAQRFQPLQQLAPDNAAAWLAELAAIPSGASARRLPEFAAQRASIIEQIAAKPRFDTYRIALIHRLLAALQDAPANPEQVQGSAAFTRWFMASTLYAGWASPPFQGIALACEPRPTATRLRQACDRLGETMAWRGDTLLANWIGSDVAIANAPDADARKTAQARRRELLWLYHAMQQAGRQPGFTARFLAQWDRYPRETETMRAIIRAAGWPTTPAPGWQPTSPLRG